MTHIHTNALSLGYDGDPIISALDISIPSGQITVLVGPNGCGKSTLLRGMARLLKPQAGTVLLNGHDISTIPTKTLAKQMGILPQSPTAPEGLTVYELVAQGRYPHQGWLRQWSKEDEAAVEDALSITGVKALADRPVDALSGGQRQRAWIAMTLAQDTETILLDEPTTFLDLAYQIEVLELLRQLNQERGKTIVMVLHDLNHAARYADHLIALRDGAILAEGAPHEVVTEAVVRDVFCMECSVIDCPITGAPLVIPAARGGLRIRRPAPLKLAQPA